MVSNIDLNNSSSYHLISGQSYINKVWDWITAKWGRHKIPDFSVMDECLCYERKKKTKNIPANICGNGVLIVIEKKTRRKCEKKSSLWGKGLPSPNKNFSHMKIQCMLQK